MKKAWVYILKCSDFSYYVGYTTNLERRLQEHNSKYYPRSYTSSRRPVSLFYNYGFNSIKEARAAEKQLKGWSRAKKEALANGDFDLLHKLAECQNKTHYKYFENNE
jgi:putative endonuclease